MKEVVDTFKDTELQNLPDLHKAWTALDNKHMTEMFKAVKNKESDFGSQLAQETIRKGNKDDLIAEFGGVLKFERTLNTKMRNSSLHMVSNTQREAFKLLGDDKQYGLWFKLMDA